jgi:hypothetical protein
MTADLDRPYALDDEQIERFRSDGFVHLKHVFAPDELHRFGARIAQLTLNLSRQHLPLEERSTYGKAFLQVTNLWEQSATAREFVWSRKIARLAAELLGVEGVRLYHDQSLFKEPGGGITPAHADQFYWPLASDRSITAWIPLQDVPVEMGPIGFYARSHRFEGGRDLPISDESEAQITAEMERHGFPLVTEPFELGDVSFHSGWTFHRAGPNLTDRPRSAMTIIYMDRDMRLGTPANRSQEIDRAAWCPGARIGQVIDTPRNPILWER